MTENLPLYVIGGALLGAAEGFGYRYSKGCIINILFSAAIIAELGYCFYLLQSSSPDFALVVGAMVLGLVAGLREPGKNEGNSKEE